MRKRSGQVHSRESSATLQLTVSLLYRQYCVNVRKKGEYEKRDMLFEEMYRAGMLKEVHPDAQDFFVLTQEEQYKEDTGLKLEVELGVILFA